MFTDLDPSLFTDLDPLVDAELLPLLENLLIPGSQPESETQATDIFLRLNQRRPGSDGYVKYSHGVTLSEVALDIRISP